MSQRDPEIALRQMLDFFMLSQIDKTLLL